MRWFLRAYTLVGPLAVIGPIAAIMLIAILVVHLLEDRPTESLAAEVSQPREISRSIYIKTMPNSDRCGFYIDSVWYVPGSTIANVQDKLGTPDRRQPNGNTEILDWKRFGLRIHASGGAISRAEIFCVPEPSSGIDQAAEVRTALGALIDPSVDSIIELFGTPNRRSGLKTLSDGWSMQGLTYLSAERGLTFQFANGRLVTIQIDDIAPDGQVVDLTDVASTPAYRTQRRMDDDPIIRRFVTQYPEMRRPMERLESLDRTRISNTLNMLVLTGSMDLEQAQYITDYMNSR